MKKIIPIVIMLLICSCVCLLAGCGGSGGEASGVSVDDKVVTMDGVTVNSATVSKPVEGATAYSPVSTNCMVLVNGLVPEGTTLNMAINPPGVLFDEISLTADAALDAKADVIIFKDGEEVLSSTGNEISIPEGESTISIITKNDEEQPCSGEYTVMLYLNGSLISKATETV